MKCDNRVSAKDVPDEAAFGRSEGNKCIALGTGVGVLGGVAAGISGAVCPLCVVVAPALIGYGAYRRWSSSQSETKEN